jgi:hypothetical protein
MRKLITIFYLISISTIGFAQLAKYPWEGKKNYGYFNTLELSIGHGGFLKNSNLLDDIMDNPYTDIALRVGIQSTGARQWEQILGYPIYGMGFYGAYFYNENPLGSPSAVYIFINAPIKRWNKFSFKYDLGVGLAYGFNPYDSINNPNNNVISARKNVYFHLKLFAEYQISNRMDFSLGLDFNHFSNGSTQTPNLGINLANINLNARYYFNPVKSYTKHIDPNFQPEVRPEFIKNKIPKTKHYHEFSLYYAAGGKATTTHFSDGPIYFISALSANYHYKYYHIAHIGLGVDYFYEAARREWVENPTFSDMTYFGVHISHILYFSRLALVIEPGIYVSNNVEDKDDIYLRVGGRYDITKRFYAQAALKTRNGAVADFIEWGLGYRFISK